MAIDSAEKRKCVAGIAAVPMGPAVTPNASKDAEWRQQAGWGYSGISVIAISPQVMGRFFDGARHLLRRAAWDSGA